MHGANEGGAWTKLGPPWVGERTLRDTVTIFARLQQKKNKKPRKRRTARKHKAKNRSFRPQKPPQKFYAAVWPGCKI